MYQYFFVLARGIGQVMFQNNALSGLLMLIGIACNSWLLAVLAVVGNLISTLTAWLFGYDRQEIEDGLYGFNGTLVGIAVGVFMPVTVSSVLLLLFGSVLSTWIAHGFNCRNKIPGFTAPFILSVWLLLVGCRFLFPSLLFPSAASDAESHADLFRAFSLNIGQVMFQGGTVLSGLFFLAAICVNSRWDALYTVWGALLPIGIVLPFWTDYEVLNAGLLGYNGVLCGIALGRNNWQSAGWATIAILLSVLLQIAGMKDGLTTLTAPFVLSVWIVLGMMHIRKVSIK
ncbi:urea transporter [Parabacteroides sp.]|uniref:urea transporter n=1 Tax=Parabacteroides sp. TaxID=1869337 RepID=UPI0030802B15